MKKLISIIIITLGFLPLMAQNDYYIKQAQSYQREAEYYTKQALGYEQEVDYYNRQAQGYLREAEYYSKRKNYDSVKTHISNGQRMPRTRQKITHEKQRMPENVLRTI